VRALSTTREQFELFLEKIVGNGLLFSNVEDEEGRVHFERLATDELTRVFLEKARAAETTKAFFFTPRTKVAEYPASAAEPITAPATTIVGIRACGLKALQILDRVFLDDVVDPFYKARRESALIITCDCTEPWETCFCTEMGYRPYPESGFDLNLCPLDGDVVVEAGSKRGEALLKEHSGLFSEASANLLERQKAQRQAVTKRVKKINERFHITAPFQKSVDGQLTSEVWKKQGVAYSCVECGACTHVCPTCRCFLLWDQKSGEAAQRHMVWDVCVYPGYWRMAGNSSPKPHLMRRFQNRFSCKFSYFPDNYQSISCTGCGRCIEACMGNIDIRQCLSELQSVEKVSK
jgi:sulfhydrogenase subunit beta (sulfur reductase)